MVAIRTRLSTTMGAALLLFSSPRDKVFAAFPSRRLSTMALSVESGVKSAPSVVVTGLAGIRPGNWRRQIREPLWSVSR